MEKLYKCIFCDYTTNVKKAIHIHHIKPRELGGENKQYNLVYLCPNHHSQIYIPESKQGIHSIIANEAIIIIGWRFTTEGYLLEYKYYKDNIIRYIK